MSEYDPEGDEKSKSQRKREMTALQEMGRQLTELGEPQLARFPLDEELLAALREYHRIRKNEAKRRQLQYIGKLMRKADHEAIAARFEEIAAQGRRETQRNQVAESWRDKLLEGDHDQVTAFVEEYPHTDRQEFRNLVRNAVQERQNNKPPTHGRKLFRFLREVISQA